MNIKGIVSRPPLRTRDYRPSSDGLSSGDRRVLPPIRPLFAALLFLVSALGSRGAIAGDNELQITIGPGYSALPDFGEGLPGVGGGGEISYGFGAFWSVAAGAFFGHHFETTYEDTTFSPTNVTSIWLGPRFNLDIFVVVPFVSLAPEILITRGELQEDQNEVDFGLRWTIGFDYRPKRTWSAGFEFDYHSFMRRPLDYPVYITAVFRLSFYHDFGGL